VILKNNIHMVVNEIICSFLVAYWEPNILCCYKLLRIQNRCCWKVVDDPVMVILALNCILKVSDILNFDVDLTKDSAIVVLKHINLVMMVQWMRFSDFVNGIRSCISG
jgi:hypothetical protein